MPRSMAEYHANGWHKDYPRQRCPECRAEGNVPIYRERVTAQEYAALDERSRSEIETYPVRRSDGSIVNVTVPPSACRACGGDGCERCAKSDGYEPEEV